VDRYRKLYGPQARGQVTPRYAGGLDYELAYLGGKNRQLRLIQEPQVAR
jgi:hypothetical protein